MKTSKTLYSKGLIKNQKMLTQSQIQQTIFNAELENVKCLYASLKAINFSENCLVQITDEGFKILVEESRTVQAALYITKSYFTKFNLQKDACVSFGVKLNVLTECLSLFSIGNNVKNLQILYKGPGTPLIFLIEFDDEEKLTTECSIKTISYDDLLDFHLNDDNIENMIILNAPQFADLLSDVDKSEELEFLIAPTYPNFRISTMNNINSEFKIEMSRNSDMIFSFSSKFESKHRYKAAHIRYALKALSMGKTISIRTDQDGLLGIQIMIINENEKQICMEYFIVPLVDYDE